MSAGDDDESGEHKRICFCCVGDEFLSKRVQNEGVIAKCSYCSDAEEPTFTIDAMADCVETAFQQHYVRTSTQPSLMQYAMLADKESDYQWEREGELVESAIADAASIEREAATDIGEILAKRFGDWDAMVVGEETEFANDSYYERKAPGSGRWLADWDSFEKSLKTEARFFSQSAARHLAELFEGLDKIMARGRKPVLVEAGPACALVSLYRARSFPRYGDMNDALARPDRHLGPPPAEVARAGRMNAHGISVFYGASDPLVALAEVRPPVGCDVAVARFDVIRSLTLLDLNAMREAISQGSVFDPAYLDRLQRAAFLRKLSDRITVPVMPDDEDLGYLVTQAVADYLATAQEPAVDGIIFPSVQAKGEAYNVVLFHKASRVRPMELPPGTRIVVNEGYASEDRWEADYSVFEYTPPQLVQAEADQASPHLPISNDHIDPSNFDAREMTLEVDPKSLEVHTINAVSYQTDRNRLRRHRFEDRQSSF
ncbi:RES domain-containing protein [Agrobacterium tumefaciens]|uniref:RES domain-containing protein n=1 Tax=Agrobacterium tumefaciens TaxID=358 RepID=A0A2L2LMI2_AGRTU|nr:RES domain-containing protein [Agrobacterium tumefaciens]AVH45539.1 hypothetical protein At1D1609_55080 [Agrobacterium tumefaciens]NSY99337.1 RES family NAD+ phosphorylase [Agrobacterium tumefaciens]